MRAPLPALLVLLLASACQTHKPIGDYGLFYERQPENILVLPVVNNSTSAEAPIAFSSTIGSPLLRRGYYAFPPIPTASIMQSEGIYEGEQLLAVEPQTYADLLGADAVLYITIHSWDTFYMVLASGVTVSMTYELVDTATGETLWIDSATRSIQSDSSGGLLSAVLNAALTAATVQYVPLAQQANLMALASLPAGPLSPAYEKERTRYLDIKSAKDDDDDDW